MSRLYLWDARRRAWRTALTAPGIAPTWTQPGWAGTGLGVRLEATRVGHPRPDIRTRVERLLAFFLPFAGYLSVAVLLDLVYHSVIGDATSREANAYYVFFSNDPHLAAIGFVWNPLTSLTEMPLILLKGIWPALTAEAFASGIMSSVFMAGTCYQLFRFMEELGVRRTVRWLLVAAFAVNPMIVFSGGNGMSEALFLFTLVATTRYLARWLARGAHSRSGGRGNLAGARLRRSQ